MFGIRTPVKRFDGEKSPKQKSPTPIPSVRRSVGEWEAASAELPPRRAEPLTHAGSTKTANKISRTQPNPVPTSRGASVEASPPPKPSYVDRTAEARACLTKAKLHLNSSRNTKTEIKTAILEALDRMYQLVKEGEAERKKAALDPKPAMNLAAPNTAQPSETVSSDLTNKIAEHSELLKVTNKRMEDLKEALTQHQSEIECSKNRTYATVTAQNSGLQTPSRTTLHSIVVKSTDGQETGEDVLNKVREAVDAKEGWVKVERTRKAKDQKVIMGFATTQERDKVKERLSRQSKHLTVEEVRNRDPLLILRGVLSANTDEDVTEALRNQNRDVFHDLGQGEEDRLQIRYRRRARNPHACHIVISVSPVVWQRAIKRGNVHVDLQRVKVEDQSPLTQCSRCLGYGHGRKFCSDTVDICSHCGGQHLRPQCPEWLAETPPSCVNCTRAKLQKVDHNTFSEECPVRRKWDSIARSSVAYC